MCATRGAGDVVVQWTGSVSRVRVGALYFLFVNDLSDSLEALTLLFVNDVKMETLQAQKSSLPRSLITAWDWSERRDVPINTAKCNC